jgi:hypothetical protein
MPSPPTNKVHRVDAVACGGCLDALTVIEFVIGQTRVTDACAPATLAAKEESLLSFKATDEAKAFIEAEPSKERVAHRQGLFREGLWLSP